MIRRILRSQLRINMVSGVATAGVNTVVMAVGYPIYLHFLGYEQYGVWLVLTTVLTFAQLGNLGIGPAVMKLVAEEHGRHDIAGIERYATTAIALLSLSGTAVLAVILVFKRPIVALFGLTSANAQIALWLLPYVGVLSAYVLIMQVLEGALSGLGRMDLANYRGLLARVINLVVSSLLLSLGFGIGSLLIGRTTAEIVTHLAIFVCIRRTFGIRILRLDGLDVTKAKRLLGFGGMVFGSSLLSMFFSPFNKLLLSRYAGVAAVPVYEMALTATMQIRGLVAAGHTAVIPEISRVSMEMTVRARDRIMHVHQQSLRLVFLFAVPLYGLLVVLAPVLLKLWLGDRFMGTLPGAFRIMLMGTFVSILGVPASNILLGTGHVRDTLIAHILLAAVNVATILCVLAALEVTVATVAWSSSVAMAAMTLFLVVQKRRVLNNWGSHEEHQPITLVPACPSGD